MVRINGKTITMTRGDSLHAVVNMVNMDGTPFVPAEGDIVLFVANTTYGGTSTLIEVEVPHDTLTLNLEPEDTADLEIGNYVWEMKLIKADGDVDTFIDKGTLRLDQEVIVVEEVDDT